MRSLLRSIPALFSTVALLASCITIPLGSQKPTLYFQVAGSGSANVYMMRVDGIITAQSSTLGFIPGETVPSTVEQVRFQLDRLERDEIRPVGILLRINSPGGTVTASDIIYHELAAFKKKHGIPIVVLMMDIAASGGYYIAMSADSVVAHPTTTTGSLGVIMPSINVSKFMETYGLVDASIMSGPMKDLHSMTQPTDRSHELVVQSVVDDLYQRFVEVVRLNRGDRLKKPMEEIADGRIYTASQAKEVGLVDRIGYFDDALDELRRLSGVSEFRVITLGHQPDAGDPTIYMQQSARPRVNLGVLSARAGLQQSSAPFYYLWLPR